MLKYLNLGSAIFELAQASAEIHESCPTDIEKRELLKAVFLNVKIRDGNIVPDYKNGLELVAARAKNNDWLNTVHLHQHLSDFWGLVGELSEVGGRHVGLGLIRTNRTVLWGYWHFLKLVS